jgi:hypothetical protein
VKENAGGEWNSNDVVLWLGGGKMETQLSSRQSGQG